MSSAKRRKKPDGEAKTGASKNTGWSAVTAYDDRARKRKKTRGAKMRGQGAGIRGSEIGLRGAGLGMRDINRSQDSGVRDLSFVESRPTSRRLHAGGLAV
jgi:hypothetical protein